MTDYFTKFYKLAMSSVTQTYLGVSYHINVYTFDARSLNLLVGNSTLPRSAISSILLYILASIRGNKGWCVIAHSSICPIRRSRFHRILHATVVDRLVLYLWKSTRFVGVRTAIILIILWLMFLDLNIYWHLVIVLLERCAIRRYFPDIWC